jgi:molecular chaperone DnaK (HSP70)
MVKDAEPTRRRQRAARAHRPKNQADSLAYQAEKQLADMGDKVPAADKEKAEGQIKELKAAVEAENFDQIKSLTEELQQTLYGISTNLYQQAGGDAAAGAPGPDAAADGGTSGGDDDVIDAEFTDTESK